MTLRLALTLSPGPSQDLMASLVARLPQECMVWLEGILQEVRLHAFDLRKLS